MDSLRADLTGTDADGQVVFRASGQVEKFDGWRRAYAEASGAGGALPDLEEEQVLRLVRVHPERHETEPPPRYNQRSLIELLEEEGIGRPSTYASIIQTLTYREYVRAESGRFFPTALGEGRDGVPEAALRRGRRRLLHRPPWNPSSTRSPAGPTAGPRWSRASSPRSTTGSPSASPSGHASRSRTPSAPTAARRCRRCSAARAGSGSPRASGGRTARGRCRSTPTANVTTVEELQPDETVPCPECGKGTIRREGRYGPVLRMPGLPELQGHRERRAAHRHRLPEVRPGTADAADVAVRQALLRVQPLPRLRLRAVDPAACSAVSAVRRTAQAAAPQREEPDRRRVRTARRRCPSTPKRPAWSPTRWYRAAWSLRRRAERWAWARPDLS